MIITDLGKLARGVDGGAACARVRRARVSPLIGMPSILTYLARTDGERGERLARGASRPPSTPRARLNAKGAVQLFLEELRADDRMRIRKMPFTVSDEGTPANEELLGCRRALARLLREAAARRPLREPQVGVATEAARGSIAPRGRSARPSARIATSRVTA